MPGVAEIPRGSGGELGQEGRRRLVGVAVAGGGRIGAEEIAHFPLRRVYCTRVALRTGIRSLKRRAGSLCGSTRSRLPIPRFVRNGFTKRECGFFLCGILLTLCARSISSSSILSISTNCGIARK